ncbi:hypothetical protein [Helicobacter suis]|uniref:hypothetical protein n=1 Tax=Helicobacter suis TaxID=104628 RepID=UPI000CF171C0|nr:hypothetical protein [Helicobacter suis]
MATYAGNSKATSLLKGVLQNIASKKARFKSLLRLSKNGGSLRFGNLDSLPNHIKSKTLKDNPPNDLFDFFFAKTVLDNSLLMATHRDTRKLRG